MLCVKKLLFLFEDVEPVDCLLFKLWEPFTDYLFGFVDTEGLHVELEHILLLAQVDFMRKFFMSNALTTSSALVLVAHYSFWFVLSEILNVKNSQRTESF